MSRNPTSITHKPQRYSPPQPSPNLYVQLIFLACSLHFRSMNSKTHCIVYILHRMSGKKERKKRPYIVLSPNCSGRTNITKQNKQVTWGYKEDGIFFFFKIFLKGILVWSRLCGFFPAALKPTFCPFVFSLLTVLNVPPPPVRIFNCVRVRVKYRSREGKERKKNWLEMKLPSLKFKREPIS